MLEWLSQEINIQDHPLDFKFIKVVTQYSDLAQGPPGPRVVIVDGLDLETGSFAQQAFLDFKSSGHLLLLTSQSVPANSLTRKLLRQWEYTSPSLSPETPRPIVAIQAQVEIGLEQRIPLEGEDLAQWKRMDRVNREQKDAELFYEERQRNLLEGAESDSEEEEEDQLILDSELPGTQRLRGSVILLQDGTYDFWLGDVSGARASLKHFPFIDRRKRFDEYGVTLKPDEFVRLEDDNIAISRTAKVTTGVKRKWDQVDMDVEDVPARVERSQIPIDVNIRLGFVDLEGLHDGRAVGNLLPRLNARKMVRPLSFPFTYVLGSCEFHARRHRRVQIVVGRYSQSDKGDLFPRGE